MKKVKILSLVLCTALFMMPAGALSPYSLPETIQLDAAAAMVIHLGVQATQDAVIYEKDADSMRSPAALVRLMAGAYAIEQIKEKGLDMDATTGTFTPALDTSYIQGTGLATSLMKQGEKWTLRDLLTVSLIQSAADTAVTLAATISGSVTAFVEGMNALAAKIGCENTSFANVTGLDSLSQYTTPRDLYRITRYAMDFAEFEPLMSTAQHKVTPLEKGTERTFVNRNDMLRASTPYYYSPMAFGRTGFTDQAGWSLVSLARDSGYEYIVIVMGCPAKNAQGKAGSHYLDTKALYKWAFNNFQYKPLLTKNEIVAHLKVRLAWDKDMVALVPKEEFATVVYNQLNMDSVIKRAVLYENTADAPIQKGTVYGKVEIIINVDQKIGEVELVAGESVERSEILAAWEKVRTFLSSPWFYAALGLLFLLLIGYVILTVLHNRKRRKQGQIRRYSDKP